MTRWTPQTGTKEFPPEPQKIRINHRAIVNPFPDGTLIRASAGETVIVGAARVVNHEWGTYITVRMDGLKSGLRNGATEDFTIRPGDGWAIELVVVS